MYIPAFGDQITAGSRFSNIADDADIHFKLYLIIISLLHGEKQLIILAAAKGANRWVQVKLLAVSKVIGSRGILSSYKLQPLLLCLQMCNNSEASPSDTSIIAVGFTSISFSRSTTSLPGLGLSNT